MTVLSNDTVCVIWKYLPQEAAPSEQPHRIHHFLPALQPSPSLADRLSVLLWPVLGRGGGG